MGGHGRLTTRLTARRSAEGGASFGRRRFSALPFVPQSQEELEAARPRLVLWGVGKPPRAVLNPARSTAGTTACIGPEDRRTPRTTMKRAVTAAISRARGGQFHRAASRFSNLVANSTSLRHGRI